jgi:hypothetical protein
VIYNRGSQSGRFWHDSHVETDFDSDSPESWESENPSESLFRLSRRNDDFHVCDSVSCLNYKLESSHKKFCLLPCSQASEMSSQRKRSKPKAADEDFTVSTPKAKAKPNPKPKAKSKLQKATEVSSDLSGGDDACDDGPKSEVESVLKLLLRRNKLICMARTTAGMPTLHGVSSRQSLTNLKSRELYFRLQVGMLRQPRVEGSPRPSTIG